MPRRTKIVATLGPACDRPETVDDLLRAGVDVFRLALAHGGVGEHRTRLATVREAAARLGRSVAVLADLPGPKVRTGEFAEGGAFLAEGAEVRLVPAALVSDAETIGVDYGELLAGLVEGDRLALGDGAVALEVTAVREGHAVAEVVHGGRLEGRPGVHLPAGRMGVPVPTPEDERLLAAMVESEVDIVAVSFVQDADDLRRARRLLPTPGPMLVAKVETAAAVDHLDEIIAAADAVMVARGDLGTEVPLEDVPHIQKRIIRTCVAFGRPVITATQMLESMVHAPTPTRAEASDVANAVFDGTDAVMLSGETAIGHDPPLVVRTMSSIAARAEREADYGQWGGRLGRLQSRGELPSDLAVTAAVTHAAWRAATEIEAAAVLCCTRSGLTARAMARFRPAARLLGMSPDPRTVRQLALSWGVEPLGVEEYSSTDEMVWCVVEAAVTSGCVHPGDVVAVLAGSPDDPEPATDVLRLVRVR